IAAAANSAGAAEIMKLIKSTFLIDKLGETTLQSIFTTTSYKNASVIIQAVQKLHFKTCIPGSSGRMGLRFVDANRHIPFCQSVWKQTQAASQAGKSIVFEDGIRTAVQNIVTNAEGPANAAAEAAEVAKTATIKATQEKAIEAASTHLYTTIGYTILAILIIVLIMLIIYLILRYRRKKKMKK
ncbi:rifin, partial [Plasmodium reichenowi]